MGGRLRGHDESGGLWLLSGGIRSVGECPGLRLLEDQETKLAALRAALIEGEESGASKPLDMDDFVARKRSKKTQIT